MTPKLNEVRSTLPAAVFEQSTTKALFIFARIKLVLYDDRPGSPTHGEIQEVFLGPDAYALVIIPPEVWNGFKGMSDPYAIVANCCTEPHDPARSSRLDPFKNTIPYDWNVREH